MLVCVCVCLPASGCTGLYTCMFRCLIEERQKELQSFNSDHQKVRNLGGGGVGGV